MAALKVYFQQYRPLKLYLIIILTGAYFFTQLVVSHVTHALTLLVDGYHVLCNLIVLIGCIITIKSSKTSSHSNSCEDIKNNKDELQTKDATSNQEITTKKCRHPEKELQNTFGWARIDVLVMLIGCVFLASLCFSLLVEALQTLIHISHHDEMHYPIHVLCVGLVGLAVNLVCYLLIGGYTYHQGSFLQMNKDGDVILASVSENSVAKGQRQFSSQTRKFDVTSSPNIRQGARETFRDVIGSLLVVLTGLIVYYTDKDLAKYIDPIVSMVSSILLLILSYPYMKESCLILLQTIPNHINISSMEKDLLNAFPGIIVNIHDFHIWQLTANKTVCTVHIIFWNPNEYIKTKSSIELFFNKHGISHVTVQPEFFKDSNSIEIIQSECLVKCMDERCIDCQCCTSESSLELKSITIEKNTKLVRSKSILSINGSTITGSSQNYITVMSDSHIMETPKEPKSLKRSLTKSNQSLVKTNESFFKHKKYEKLENQSTSDTKPANKCLSEPILFPINNYNLEDVSSEEQVLTENDCKTSLSNDNIKCSEAVKRTLFREGCLTAEESTFTNSNMAVNSVSVINVVTKESNDNNLVTGANLIVDNDRKD